MGLRDPFLPSSPGLVTGEICTASSQSAERRVIPRCHIRFFLLSCVRLTPGPRSFRTFHCIHSPYTTCNLVQLGDLAYLFWSTYKPEPTTRSLIIPNSFSSELFTPFVNQIESKTRPSLRRKAAPSLSSGSRIHHLQFITPPPESARALLSSPPI